jgi:hypothetical protein
VDCVFENVRRAPSAQIHMRGEEGRRPLGTRARSRCACRSASPCGRARQTEPCRLRSSTCARRAGRALTTREVTQVRSCTGGCRGLVARLATVIARGKLVDVGGNGERCTRSFFVTKTSLSMSSSASVKAPALNNEQKRWYLCPLRGNGSETFACAVSSCRYSALDAAIGAPR